MRHSLPSPSHCRFLPLVVIVLVLAAGLRSCHLSIQPLSRDEGTAALTVTHSLTDMIRLAREEGYSLGHEMLLMGWQIAGSSEIALRLSSVLIEMLTVALAFRLGASFFNRPTGLLASVAVAINPMQVYYSQDATASALIGLLSLASLYMTHSMLKIPACWQTGRLSKRQTAILAAGYVMVNAAGLYTQFPLFALFIGAETLIFLVWLSPQSHKLHGIGVWLVLQAVTVALVAPWLPIGIEQLTYPESRALDLISQLKELAYGPTLPAEAAQNGLIPLLLLATFGLFPPARPSSRPMHFLEGIGLVVVGLVIPLTTLVGGTYSHQRFPDLLVPANLALMLLTARGVTLGYEIGNPVPALGRSSGGMMHGMVLLMSTIALFPVLSGLQHLYTDPLYTRDDYRSIGARIREQTGSQAAVVLDRPEQLGVITYYYPEGKSILTLPNEDTERTLAELIASHRRIYGIFWNTADRQVEETLEAHGIVASTEQYGSTKLVIYAVTGQPAPKPHTLSGAQFGPSINLDGFTLSASTLSPGEGLGVTLFWHTNAHLEASYKVFVHLYSSDGTLLTQHDSEPADFTAPTTTWAPGQTVADHHKLLMPSAPPGTYTVIVGMYDPAADRLPVSVNGEPAGDRVKLVEFIIP